MSKQKVTKTLGALTGLLKAVPKDNATLGRLIALTAVFTVLYLLLN